MDALEVLKALAVDNPLATAIVGAGAAVLTLLRARLAWIENKFDAKTFDQWVLALIVLLSLVVYSKPEVSQGWQTEINISKQKK